LINSWNSYVSIYGDINASYELGYSVYQFFSNGGVECYVVRVLTQSAVANTSSLLALTHGSSQSLFTATSKLAGVDGNDITLVVTKASGNPDSSTTGGSGILNLTVNYKGTAVETFNDLTFSNDTGATSATIKVNDAVSGSQYITISAQSTDSNVTGTKFNTAFTGDVTYTLASGATNGVAAKATGSVQGNTANVAANHFLLTAENSGAWSSGLAVEVEDGREVASATSYGTFTLIVRLDGAEKERWTEISLDSTHNRYVLSLLNNYSDYVRVSNVVTPTKDTNTKVNAGVYSLVGGSNGLAVAAADYTTSVAFLDQVTGDLLINLPGVSGTSEVNAAISYASGRGTGFVIIDPDVTKTTAAEAVTLVDTYSNSGYGAVYYPGATVADPTRTGPAALRTAPLGGAVMAIYGKAERMHSVAKAPAGFNLDLANVFGLVANYTESDESTLYDAHINPVRLVPGTGAIINGTRTLAVTSPAKYIPIRRTLNFIKARVKAISAFAVFEPNDANLRQKVVTVIQQELRSLWAKGGLKGNTESQAFYVTCNATNNTTSTVANGELHVEVGLALQYPAEYIIVNVSQWTGGANAVDIL
jgi:hypothetical protein